MIVARIWKARIRDLASLASALVAVGLMLTGIAAGQPGTPDRALSGSVGTLPIRDDDSLPHQLIAGHVRLLGRTLDQAIDHLQHADLRGFAVSYKQMVDSYTALTDQIGEASEALGSAATRIALARSTLTGLSPTPRLDESLRAELAADIEQIQMRLIARMAALRAQVDHADSARREKTLRDLQTLVGRLENLNSLQSLLQQNDRPLAPSLAPAQLNEQLRLMEEAITEEERLLGVVARSAQLLVSNSAAQLRHTMTLLEVQAQLPREQVAQLQRSRAAVQNILDDLVAAHGSAAERAGQMLDGRTVNQKPLDAEQLLRRVDQLIDGSGGRER